jgi:GTP cyclohydrolase II
MNKKTLKALIEAGAVKKAHIIAEGSTIYVEVDSGKQTITAKTVKGKLKTWRSLDTAAKWVRSLGIGNIQLNIAKWQPEQKGFIYICRSES